MLVIIWQVILERTEQLLNILDSFLDDCRILHMKTAMKGYYFQSHVFRSVNVQQKSACEVACYLYSNCISLNIVSSHNNGQLICELCSSDHKTHPPSLLRRLDSTYQPFKVFLFPLLLFYFFMSFSFFFKTTFYVQDKLTSVKTEQKENLMLVNPRLFSFSFHTSM